MMKISDVKLKLKCNKFSSLNNYGRITTATHKDFRLKVGLMKEICRSFNISICVASKSTTEAAYKDDIRMRDEAVKFFFKFIKHVKVPFKLFQLNRAMSE